ncbi:MAG: OsmC family protein [Phycisphaerales bacterium JB039]
MTKLQESTLNGIDVSKLVALVESIKDDPARGQSRFGVTTRWEGGARTATKVDGWELGGRRIAKDFTIHIDEPLELCGTNTQANPQEYLFAAMNACLAATYVAACAVNGIELESLEIETTGEIDLRGFLAIDARVPAGYEQVQYTVRIKGSGTPEQFEQIHRHVMATSPNYYNINRPIALAPTLVVE